MTLHEDGNGSGGSLSISEVEAALGRIPSVTAARVVTAAGGRVTEVHVLARRDRAPKQLVRDVQSVALTTFGLEVDYRTISVVQLDEPATEEQPVSASNLNRVALIKLSTDVAGPVAEVRVFLSAYGSEWVGAARGPTAGWDRLVAKSVVDAVSPLLGPTVVEVDFAEVLRGGSHKVALTILRMVTDRGEQVVSGSAVVHQDLHDAMARASLAALNRLTLRP